MPAKRTRAPARHAGADLLAFEAISRPRRRSRPPSNIITVSILGSDYDPPPKTKKRAKLLDRIVEALIQRTAWASIDAVVLPGGYFRLDRPIGSLDDKARTAALARTDIGRACATASQTLNQRWPGVCLCIGVDSFAPSDHVGGDQLVAAWRDGKLIGHARKIFPVDGDTNRKKRAFAVNPGDFRSPARFLTLASGAQAVLCACYDAFGLRAVADAGLADLKAIRTVLAGRSRAIPATAEHHREAMKDWRALLATHPPDLALVAIHRFKKPGQEGLWQRHGIAGASAALGGAPVVGASHFTSKLPDQPNDCPLCASDVPPAHLGKGARRQAHLRKPDGSLRLANKRGEDVAIIRLFSFSASN